MFSMLNTFVIISTQTLSSKYNTYIITDLHDITEILLNVALNTIPVTLTKGPLTKGRLNSIMAHKAKQCTGDPTYKTTRRNKNVNG